MNLFIITLLSLLLSGIVYLLFMSKKKEKELKQEAEKKTARITELEVKYKDVIDVDAEAERIKKTVDALKENYRNIDEKYRKKEQELSKNFRPKREIYEKLLAEISLIEEDLDNISFGIYKPQFQYETSEEFKNAIKHLREEQKELVKSNAATFCPVNWKVRGSEKEGEKLILQVSKLMLKAFNGECDSAIARVSWKNVEVLERRLDKAFEDINQLGATNQISITEDYKILKIKELHMNFELQEKKHQEREEQRRIREDMREQAKIEKEIARKQKEAEAEEIQYEKALEKARRDVSKMTGDQLNELNAKILELEQHLKEAKEAKERAISQAQLTKAGHVYVISNVGSFGKDIYKIGMTRRLEPLDRVRELGGASVPFEFDVHAMIYSENAPELESTLHRLFNDKRLNLVNTRREFFNISLDEIADAAKNIGVQCKLTKVAEAREYRESLSARLELEKNINNAVDKKTHKSLSKFPETL